jgi:hypothetical protein
VLWFFSLRFFRRRFDAIAGSKPAGELVADGTTVVLRQRERILWTLNWDEVDGIIAFKRDLYTTDLICLEMHSGHSGLSYSVHEEMKGYESFLSHMEERFEIPRSSWWEKVAKPAFKEDRTVLYHVQVGSDPLK